jgi:tetratricopeptide (TPR) repeat protein
VSIVPPPRSNAVLLAGLAAMLAGCAPALRTAPPLAELAGGVVPARDRAPALLERARALYAGRGVQPVREAASLALRAAAADPTDDAALVLAARTLVWLADHETEAGDRERAATRAVQAAQWCGAGRAPTPPCSFWLGAALGVQARERPTTGVSALPAIAAAFETAAAGDPAYENGAPDQALALFYLRAPGWPTGPGDPGRGLEHARRAVATAPDHAPNLLALGEALAATGDAAGSRERFEEALSRARAAAQAGDPDAAEWMHEAQVALGTAVGR